MLLAVRLRRSPQVRGAIDVDPEVLESPLGFQDRDFPALERGIEASPEQIWFEYGVVASAEQHRAARQRIDALVDHEVCNGLFHLCP